MELSRHPLSAAFPSMPAAEQDELTSDIEKNGQREPIIVFEGMILDGWHRYNSCNMLEIEPVVSILDSGIDPVSYVISRNIHRRHLSGSQRAAAIVACSVWAESGRPEKGAAASPFVAPALTNEVMANIANVNKRTIQKAKVVQSAGLVDRVTSGEMSIESAYNSIRPSKPKSEPPAVAPSVVDELHEETVSISKSQLEEMQALVDHAHADSVLLESVFDADDKLVAAVAEIRSLGLQVSTLRSRLEGEQNKNNELIRIVKSKDKLISKLEKELEAYKLEDLPL